MIIFARKQAYKTYCLLKTDKDTLKSWKLDRKILNAEEMICKQKEVIEELTDIQKQSEDAAMNEMHGYMSDTKHQFETMRKKLKDKEIECAR